MNKPNPIADAIGVVKLVSMHHANPGAVSAATAIGKSVEGVTAIIAAKLSRPMAGCGEVAQ
ncbi:hypothetical protein [Ectopseudomonas alcaliphila]|uniref:Uncharacterized protein n=1 Tax=Ectopseudomonas alcaliphila TaxID=101564 RepID=A0A1G7MQH6_9GAMM|nr:hypothetical protein [Pseudomonas alcaliphila]MDX5994917.1 hypothetical protein [Pseudomonas alcaliphila]SDF63921.1 hypothetical protein SAMN05216575_109103 [Pseudomonas alcaliphila]